ncbi:MAG TPA: glycosyltransferase [Promicromonospora sp.]|nr:glycosyltransferase [Promicromonospora sp.]
MNGLHICFFTDQHPDTLGGAQASVQLQRTFLERAGHTVTIVAPRSPVVPAADPDVVALPDPDVVALPGPTVARGQYTAALPGRRLDALVDRELAARGPVDVVHLQGDFWGAWLGKRFAARHGLPVVLTTHTNVDASFRAVAGPLAGIGLGAVAAWQRAVTGHLTARPARRSGLGAGYDYLRALASGAAAVVAPSAHFAARLEAAGVPVTAVVPTGVHDDDVHGLRDGGHADGRPGRRTPRRPGDPVRVVWLSRFSAEKRPLELLDALAATDLRVEADLYGTGVLFERARRRVHALGLADRVRLHGAVGHAEALRAIAAADLLVQTSQGFETQGMTVYEALALGVPVVVRDPDIAHELGGAGWVRHAPGRSAASLASALDAAAQALGTQALPRVPGTVSAGLLQSAQTRRLLDVYAGVLGGGAQAGAPTGTADAVTADPRP